MNYLIRKVGSAVRVFEERAYSYFKVRETGLQFISRLSFIERQHFLKLRPILVGSNLVAYDVGAANGTVSSCFAKVKNICEVHAFEPIPSAFSDLKQRVKDFPNVICHNVALGNINGEQQMWVTDRSRDSSSILKMGQTHKDEYPSLDLCDHGERVKLVRLDDYVVVKKMPFPDIVKIDVQGYEDQVILGGQKTLVKAKFCILEISFVPLYENSPVFDHIYRLMQNLGFRLTGVIQHYPGISGGQLQMDGIFQNENLCDKYD